MAKRIEIGVPNQTYLRLEQLADEADLKVNEVIHLGLRQFSLLADPAGFLAWLNGGGANAAQGVRAENTA